MRNVYVSYGIRNSLHCLVGLVIKDVVTDFAGIVQGFVFHDLGEALEILLSAFISGDSRPRPKSHPIHRSALVFKT